MLSTPDNSTPTSTLEGRSQDADAIADARPSEKPRRPRGFAAMDQARAREISSKGGKAAHAAGTAHQFSSAEATDAGRKGGTAPHVRRGRGRRTPNGAPATSNGAEPRGPAVTDAGGAANGRGD